MDERRYTTVTVVYEGDLPLLEVQARSLAVHADTALVAAVVVIDNTRLGLGRRAVRRLTDGYGPLAPCVRVVAAHTLASRRDAGGWWGQQLLKILVAGVVATDRYLVLDAKNVLVRTLERTFLEGPDGRPRLGVQEYATHPHRPRLERSLRWWDVDPEPYVARFGPTVTPFVMDTALVLAMVDDAERRAGATFPRAFADQGVTEFFFWMGWLVSRGSLEDVYDLDQVRCPVVWPGDAAVEALHRAVEVSGRDRAPFLTVHQKALAAFDAERARVLADFWARSGLFATAEGAIVAVAGFQRTWRWVSTAVRVRSRVRATGLVALARVRRAAGPARRSAWPGAPQRRRAPAGDGRLGPALQRGATLAPRPGPGDHEG